MSRKPPLFLLLLLLLAAAPALAYTVVLKDGTTMAARSKYEVQGDKALITLINGTQTVIDLAEIDRDRTEEANQGANLGTALVVTSEGTEALRASTASEGARTLSDLILERQRLAAQRRGEAGAEESERDPTVRSTAAGWNDLSSLRRTPLDERQVESTLTRLLSEETISQYRVYRGTASERVFLEVVAGSDDEVFEALEALSRVTLDLLRQHPEIDALEILMSSKSRSRAGQFVLDEQNAPLLANGRMSAPDFFVEHVQF